LAFRGNPSHFDRSPQPTVPPHEESAVKTFLRSLFAPARTSAPARRASLDLQGLDERAMM